MLIDMYYNFNTDLDTENVRLEPSTLVEYIFEATVRHTTKTVVKIITVLRSGGLGKLGEYSD